MKVILWVLPRIPLRAIPSIENCADSELESTVLPVSIDQKTSEMKRQNYQLQQNILASREKILLGSNITTIQFSQGSFKEMHTTSPIS